MFTDDSDSNGETGNDNNSVHFIFLFKLFSAKKAYSLRNMLSLFLFPGLLQNSRAMGTTGRIIGNCFLAERAGTLRCFRRFGKHSIHLTNHQENHKCNNQKINDRI